MNRRAFIGSTGAAFLCVALPAEAAAAPAFAFSSDFTLSLHHTLYRQAGALLAYYSGGLQSMGGLQRRFYDEITAIPASAQSTWYRALSLYGNRYSGRSFVFDAQMVRFENELADDRIPAPLQATLQSAAPIYRSALWPLHDAANRKWIAQQRADLSELGAQMSLRLSAIYGVPWLRIPYRVAVVPSTDRDTAFSNFGTSNRYFLIVASSMDRSISGWGGFETLYHEASHSIVDPAIDGIGRDIATIAAALDRPVPTDLWHALIMYTPGAVLTPLLAQRGIAGFASSFEGLLSNVYPRYYQAFKSHWQPYLDGSTTRNAALHAVVEAVTSATT